MDPQKEEAGEQGSERDSAEVQVPLKPEASTMLSPWIPSRNQPQQASMVHRSILYKILYKHVALKCQEGGPSLNDLLRSCSSCGRRFRASRLPVHEEICSKNAGKKCGGSEPSARPFKRPARRSVFESSRQRCEVVSGRWWSEELRSSQRQRGAEISMLV